MHERDMSNKQTGSALLRESKLNKKPIRVGNSIKQPLLIERRAMTLVEVIVAMAILSIIAVMCVSAFMVTLGSEMRETNTRRASEEAEIRIASGAEATASSAGALRLGNYNIKTNVDSYSETVGEDDVLSTESQDGSTGSIDTSGSRSYTILRDEGSTQTPLPIFFGDFEYEKDPSVFEAFQAMGDAQDTGPLGTGEPKEVTITVPGRYSLEVWGGRGGGTDLSLSMGVDYSGGGKGGYSYGEVNLNRGDKLYLCAGGAGRIIRQENDWLEKITGPYSTWGGGGDLYSTSGTTGGGSSAVRVNFDDPYARVIVAGGGGGGGFAKGVSTHNNNVGVTSGGYGGGEWGGRASDKVIYTIEVVENGKNETHTYVRGQGARLYGGGSYSAETQGDRYNPVNRRIYNWQVDPKTAQPGLFGDEDENGGKNIGGQGVGADFLDSDNSIGLGFGGGSGGGGWYSGSGGYINGGGGGSGWVYTEAMFNEWNKQGYQGESDSKNYKLGPKYMLDNARLWWGYEDIPDPLDTSFDPDHPEYPVSMMKGNGRGGFVRVIYLGESLL
jgi:prepilin-type N-terminal cleavage/methylation domain-containing protein